MELRITPHGAAAALSLECLGYGELRDLEKVEVPSFGCFQK